MAVGSESTQGAIRSHREIETLPFLMFALGSISLF
jgi:hypothetical protein